MAEQLLNFDAPFDVDLLDRVVNAMYGGNQRETQEAQKILTAFQQHPQSWMRVSQVLQQSQNINTKFIALQVLQEAIRLRWNILPEQQRTGIKNYIVKTVIEKSSNPEALVKEKVYVQKLNEVLVAIVKNEWPQNWRTFIPEIVNASKSNESLCENNMHILQLLSEEIFDFSSGKLTQSKIKELSETFTNEFQLIYQLCEFILQKATKPSLIQMTLRTLAKFIAWIPRGYIFQTQLIEALLKFFTVPVFRNAALNCMSEIAGLQFSDPQQLVATGAAQKLELMFYHFMQQLIASVLPTSINIPDVYEGSSDYDQKFVQALGLFFSTFFKQHLKLVEKEQYKNEIIRAHMYLVEISKIDNTELFKTCLDYWNFLAQDLYFAEAQANKQIAGAAGPYAGGFLAETPATARKMIYEQEIMPRLRLVMISKMAKPEEVIIVEDENGDIIKEHMKDVDSIQLYKTMRDTLIYLTHLNVIDTERIMLQKLTAQVDGSEWAWHNLNTLCWAIGSISGAMEVKHEKRFLVTVIRDLLRLCEMKRGKENKAVIASNIMYVVGQYPRFLMDHWKFLKTVVNKLFEFMHEKFAGVQEMACETFVKISKRCKRKFVELQEEEHRPFVEEIIRDLPQHICDLEQQHIHVFYEAVGHMISAAMPPSSSGQQSPFATQDQLLMKLMEMPNARWTSIIDAAQRNNAESLKDTQIMRDLVNLLKANVHVAQSVGAAYVYQMRHIFTNMLNLYRFYAQFISNEVAQQGPLVTRHAHVRLMRQVKKETLKLVETFISQSKDQHMILNEFARQLLDATILDYKNSVPDAKDPGVLTLLRELIDKLGQNGGNGQQSLLASDEFAAQVPKVVLENVLDCTLPMITKNFEDYPEHRLFLFQLLRSINQNSFASLVTLASSNQQAFKYVMECIFWAIKHTHRNIYKTGLHILQELLANMDQLGSTASPGILASFYKTYYTRLLTEILSNLTDTMHKAGFKLQASILFYIFGLVHSGKLLQAGQISGIDVSELAEDNLKLQMAKLIGDSFRNLSQRQVQEFVQGLFELAGAAASQPLVVALDRFKAHLRDFLVVQNTWAGADDNNELYSEERKRQEREKQARLAAVPGLVSSASQQGMADGGSVSAGTPVPTPGLPMQ